MASPTSGASTKRTPRPGARARYGTCYTYRTLPLSAIATLDDVVPKIVAPLIEHDRTRFGFGGITDQLAVAMGGTRIATCGSGVRRTHAAITCAYRRPATAAICPC